MTLTEKQIERYGRHIVLKEIGGAGQAKLRACKIAIIGMGGLGGPVGLYLAAAGIGHLTLIDDDRVDLSNLQRQVQFDADDLGALKVNAAGRRFQALNEDVHIHGVAKRLLDENAEAYLSGHDLIIDGTDNFKTRLLINKTALTLATPVLSGALGQFNGQVALFPNDHIGPCYQCFVPELPPNEQSCAEFGVVGALAGIIGSVMALEAIKYIVGTGESLSGALYIYDGLGLVGRKVSLPRDPDCPTCGTKA